MIFSGINAAKPDFYRTVLSICLPILERCQSGRLELPAKKLTWETGSEGSNPSLSVLFYKIKEGFETRERRAKSEEKAVAEGRPTASEVSLRSEAPPERSRKIPPSPYYFIR